MNIRQYNLIIGLLFLIEGSILKKEMQIAGLITILIACAFMISIFFIKEND